ncbi:MAG: formate dehydrogenase subunit gamma [Lysobacterales bacterium]
MKAVRTITPIAPPDGGLPPDQLAAVHAAIDDHVHRRAPLLPILQAVQDALGCVSPGAVAVVAHALNLTRAEVHGVVTFYHDFRKEPAGRHVVKICRAEACQALGARSLEAHAKRALGIGYGETTPDGAVTLEAVYCLGNCGCGPSVMVDADDLHARVTPAAFDALVASARKAP